jgi:HK97 family phage major capsid protein
MYKDLKLGDDTLGGFLVPVMQGDRIIDLLRNRVVVQRAGATEISLPPSGNLTWPRGISDPSFGFDDPDRTSDITVTDAKFGALRFVAKNLTGAVAIPNDLIRFSSPSVEVVVRQMMAANAAVVEDRAYITGLGTSFEPKGVVNHDTAAIAGTQGKVTLHVASTVGGSGDTFEPEDVALMIAKQEESNDPDGSTAWIMRPLMWATILNKRADAVVAGDKAGPFMFPVTRGEVARAPQKMLLDVPVLTTKQIPNDRVKGGGTDLTLIILANWRRAIIARSGAMELAASEHVRFLRDQTVIKGIMRVDFGLEYEESFVFVDDVIIGS